MRASLLAIEEEHTAARERLDSSLAEKKSSVTVTINELDADIVLARKEHASKKN